MLVKRIIILILLGSLSVPRLAHAQTTAALYTLLPTDGQMIDTSFVRVQFGLAPDVSPNGIPEFRVEIDRQDPVLTSDTEYVFYWLTPGWHTVTISLVDANGTPIYGVESQVQFYLDSKES